MKKILIGVLILIPLVVVAGVLIASELISVTAYIGVDKIELNYDIVGREDGFTIENNTFSGLKATVYPKFASNPKVKWTIEEIVRFDDTVDGEIAEVDENGVVTGKTYGAFYVVATSVEGNKQARCTFNLSSDKVSSVMLWGDSQMAAGEMQMLEAVFRPTDCLVTEVNWSSSDESVLTVDGNGIVTARSAGTATVTCGVHEVAGTIAITVSASASNFGSTFYLSGGAALSELGLALDTEIIEGGNISGGSFSFTADTARLSSGGKTVTIKKCGYDDIQIDQKPFLDYTLSGKKCEVESVPVFFTASYRDALREGKPEVSWSSSSPDIGEIDEGGVLRLKKAGELTVTAQTASGASDSVEIMSRKFISYMVLGKNAADDSRGIAAETVCATKKFDSGMNIVANSIEFTVRLPENSDPDDFTYSCDSEYAEFSGNRLVFSGGFTGKREITVTVGAKYPRYSSMPVSASYKFLLADAVEVADFSEFQTATEGRHAVTLAGDIGVPYFNRYPVYNDLYGNGRIIFAEEKPTDNTQAIINIASDGVTVSNTVFRMEKLVSNEIASKDLKGVVLFINSAYNNADRPFLTGIRVEYCMIENGHFGLYSRGAQYTVDGCILRNTVSYAIYAPVEACPYGDLYSDITLNNCIFSNSLIPSIGLTSNNEPRVPTKLTSTGFLDIYNWQSISNVDLLGDVSDTEFINVFIKEYVRERYRAPEYEPYRYEENGQVYIHMAILGAGALNPTCIDVTIEDPRYHRVPLEIIAGLDFNVCIAYVYDKNADIKPGDFYVEDAALYAKLRGE